MITTKGKELIGRFNAKEIGQIATTLAIGIGSTSPTVLDKQLVYETLRINLEQTYFNRATGRVVFRAIVPASYVGPVYEIGLWSADSDSLAEAGSRTLLEFDQDTEAWVGGAWSTSNVRAGSNGLVTGPNTSATLSGIVIDLSRNLNDTIRVAAHTNANSAFRFRLGSDGGYYEYTINPGTTGFINASLATSSYTVSGTPDFSAINYATVLSPSGGPTVTWDGLRLEDTFQDKDNPDYTLINRVSSSTPLFTGVDGIETVVEIPISL